tara:strand:+ start:727 stop:1746 length:1020 start_codon:yes stop_codon:yes gene_type:complete
MYRHFRSAHEELLNANGGSPKYNIPDKRPPPLKVTSDLIDHKNAFQYLKEIIRHCIQCDHQRVSALKQSIEKHNKINNQDKVRYYANILANYNDVIEYTNQNIHHIATQWLRYLIQNKRMDTFEHESGLTFIYEFKRHGGLFQISLDRRNNDYPHFFGSLNAFQNVRDVPLCLNTSSNPFMHYPNFKQAVMDQIHLPRALNLHKLMHYKSICYQGIGSVWKSKRKVNNQVEHVLLKNMFGNLKNFQSYCLKVLKDQDYKCAITGMYLLNGMYDTMKDKKKVFSMSINAIEPTLGHVKENIEWVCRFINVCNREKSKTYHHKDDPPNAWTKELFQKYFLS